MVIYSISQKSWWGSNDYIVGMKHERHMKQVSNERQTHQVFRLEVGGTGNSGVEGGRASS
jgi:hypothetical protein